MAEGSEEEEFAYMVEEQQQKEKIELKFLMKCGQQLLTMSLIREAAQRRSSPFLVGALWHMLSDIFRMRIGKSQCC